jgi:hypothetical protein
MGIGCVCGLACGNENKQLESAGHAPQCGGGGVGISVRHWNAAVPETGPLTGMGGRQKMQGCAHVEQPLRGCRRCGPDPRLHSDGDLRACRGLGQNGDHRACGPRGLGWGGDPRVRPKPTNSGSRSTRRRTRSRLEGVEEHSPGGLAPPGAPPGLSAPGGGFMQP